MAESKTVTQLPDVGQFTADDRFLVSHKTDSTTWASRSAALAELGLAVVNALNYETLETVNKTIIGAIAELNKNKILHFARTLTFTNGLANADVSLTGYVDDETRAYPIVVTGGSEYFIVAESNRTAGHYRFPVRTTRNPSYSGTMDVNVFIIVGNIIDL